MAITKTKQWTYNDYYNLEDERRYEVIEGELIEMPSPKALHQRILKRLSQKLDRVVIKKKLGEIFIAPLDVVLCKYDVLQPDIIFVHTDNLNIVQDYVMGTPDLVIEILSPSNQSHDKIKKFNIYEKYQVTEFWLVDPEKQSITVYTLVNEKLTLFCNVRGTERIKSKTFVEIDLSFNNLIE